MHLAICQSPVCLCIGQRPQSALKARKLLCCLTMSVYVVCDALPGHRCFRLLLAQICPPALWHYC